jgi:NADH dehydrogenase
MISEKKIVILGAGYAGLLFAKKLARKIPKTSEYKITLIDQRAYQLFTFNLYEVMSSEEEFASLEDLEKAISLPINKIIGKDRIEFIQGEVSEINLSQKTLKAGNKILNYDYLILSPGSESDTYGILGAKEFAFPLKTLKDGLILRNRIEFAFFAHSLDMTKKNLRFVIAGGGYTGCEIAAELSNFVKILCWKYKYPKEKVEIQILEAAGELMTGFSQRLSRDSLFRLNELGVKVSLSSAISKISDQFVELANGEKIAYDVLVWSVGIKAKNLPILEKLNLDRKGRIITGNYLQVSGYNNVFVLGDAALVTDANKKTAVSSAQDAIDQAEYLAKVFPQILLNKKPVDYKVLKHGFIVTLGGRWAILDYNGAYIKGLFAYFIRELAHIRYLSKLMGWYEAANYVWFQNKIFGRNN